MESGAEVTVTFLEPGRMNLQGCLFESLSMVALVFKWISFQVGLCPTGSFFSVSGSVLDPWLSYTSQRNLNPLDIIVLKVKWSCSVVSDSLRPRGHQAPPSMGFSSGLPFPSPGNFPTQGLSPGLPHCRQTLYYLSHQGRVCKSFFFGMIWHIFPLQGI